MPDERAEAPPVSPPRSTQTCLLEAEQPGECVRFGRAPRRARLAEQAAAAVVSETSGPIAAGLARSTPALRHGRASGERLRGQAPRQASPAWRQVRLLRGSSVLLVLSVVSRTCRTSW